ncbi:MAG: M48 family metalloprotease [Chitinophagaceae bacterium]|nr:M48 family metalloprotease [Chitinophagaceae bacterium]
MEFLFLRNWLPAETIKAICWTLVHSLWQGLLAAALAALVIGLTRKSSARLRYNLLCGVLMSFILVSVYTLLGEFQAGQSGDAAVTAESRGHTASSITNAGRSEIIIQSPKPIDTFISFLNNHAGTIMLLWMIFFLVHCIKIFAGLTAIHRLRKDRVHEATDWQERLMKLSKAIGVTYPVKLLQSELVKVPVAIGFFKPVILVPLGLLSHLPPEQVETILLHELAHIRRRDYLINILQRFAEAVFFFNPALRWISGLIRQEREACCDDIVVANTHHKVYYLEALVSFQEYSFDHSEYAMAIGSKRHYLLNRVKRMLTRENKKLNLMEKIVLLAGLIMVSAFGFIQQQPPAAKTSDVVNTSKQPGIIVAEKKQVETKAPQVGTRTTRKRENENVSSFTDSIPPVKKQQEKEKETANEPNFTMIYSDVDDDGTRKSSTTIATDNQGKKYTITKLNGKITSLAIDGVPVPESEFGKYTTVFEKIERTQLETRIRRKAEMVARRQEAEMRREEIKERSAEARQQVKEREKERASRLPKDKEWKEAADKAREQQRLHEKEGIKNREEIQKRKEVDRKSSVKEARDKRTSLFNRKESILFRSRRDSKKVFLNGREVIKKVPKSGKPEVEADVPKKGTVVAKGGAKDFDLSYERKLDLDVDYQQHIEQKKITSIDLKHVQVNTVEFKLQNALEYKMKLAIPPKLESLPKGKDGMKAPQKAAPPKKVVVT